MGLKHYSKRPKNAAESLVERLTKRLEDTFDEFGVDVFAVCIRVKGQTPDCSAVLSADNPEDARALLIRTAALVAAAGGTNGAVQ